MTTPFADPDDVLSDMRSDFPVPNPNASLHDLRRSDAPLFEASLHMVGTDGWGSYALGFKQLADLGVMASHRRSDPQLVVYPDAIVFAVMFDYRQYLELRMKGLIAAAERYLDRHSDATPFGHNLVVLWHRLRPLLEDVWAEAEYYDTIEKQIREFADLDPTGEEFRYPVTTKGKPSLEGRHGLNLMNVKEIVDGIASVFEGSDTGIYEYLQSKYEMEAEYRANSAYYAEPPY